MEGTQGFKDRAGHQWIVSINGMQFKKLKEICNFDCMWMTTDSEKYMKSMEDVELVQSILYNLCGAQHPEVSFDAFCAEIYGDVLEEASDALQRAVINFSPRREMRPVYIAALEEQNKRIRERAAEAMANISEMMDQQLQQQLQQQNTLGTSSSSSVESPESIQTG